jgi:hypothetical protein
MPEALGGIINDRKRNNAAAVLRGLLRHVQYVTDEHVELAEHALLAIAPGTSLA